MKLAGLALTVRDLLRPWCRICRQPVDHVSTRASVYMQAVEAWTICHGVPNYMFLTHEVLSYGTRNELRAALDVYELAPLMLEAIRPDVPKVRGRQPAPEPAGVMRVFLAPPIEVRA